MTGDGAVAADVEMVTDGAEAAGLVVAQQLFHGVVTVAACGGAVDNKVTHALRAVHQQTLLDAFREQTLACHLFLAGDKWKCFCYHDCDFFKGL